MRVGGEAWAEPRAVAAPTSPRLSSYRVNRVRAARDRRRDDVGDRQVRLGRGRLPDAHRFVRQLDVEAVGVGRRVDRDRREAELFARADDAHRDLAPVGDEDLGERFLGVGGGLGADQGGGARGAARARHGGERGQRSDSGRRRAGGDLGECGSWASIAGARRPAGGRRRPRATAAARGARRPRGAPSGPPHTPTPSPAGPVYRRGAVLGVWGAAGARPRAPARAGPAREPTRAPSAPLPPAPAPRRRAMRPGAGWWGWNCAQQPTWWGSGRGVKRAGGRRAVHRSPPLAAPRAARLQVRNRPSIGGSARASERAPPAGAVSARCRGGRGGQIWRPARRSRVANACWRAGTVRAALFATNRRPLRRPPSPRRLPPTPRPPTPPGTAPLSVGMRRGARSPASSLATGPRLRAAPARAAGRATPARPAPARAPVPAQRTVLIHAVPPATPLDTMSSMDGDADDSDGTPKFSRRWKVVAMMAVAFVLCNMVGDRERGGEGDRRGGTGSGTARARQPRPTHPPPPPPARPPPPRTRSTCLSLSSPWPATSAGRRPTAGS